jgi:hypothetical protein
MYMPALRSLAVVSMSGTSAAHAGDTTISVGPSLKNSIVSAASGVSGGGIGAPAAGAAATSDQAASRAATNRPRPRARAGPRVAVLRSRRMMRRGGATGGPATGILRIRGEAATGLVSEECWARRGG